MCHLQSSGAPRLARRQSIRPTLWLPVRHIDRQSEEGCHDRCIPQHRRSGSIQDTTPILEHISEIGDAQGRLDILLDQKNRRSTRTGDENVGGEKPLQSACRECRGLGIRAVRPGAAFRRCGRPRRPITGRAPRHLAQFFRLSGCEAAGVFFRPLMDEVGEEPSIE